MKHNLSLIFKTNLGFTLVELLVSIVIIVILSTLGIASFNTANTRNELQNQGKEIQSVMRKLRTDSVAAVKPVTGDGSAGDPSCKAPTPGTEDQGTYYGSWIILDKNTTPHSFYTGSACLDASDNPLYGSSSPTNLTNGVSFGDLPNGDLREVIFFTFDGQVFSAVHPVSDFPPTGDPRPDWLKDPTSFGSTPVTNAIAIQLMSGSTPYYIYLNGAGLICAQEDNPGTCAN